MGLLRPQTPAKNPGGLGDNVGSLRDFLNYFGLWSKSNTDFLGDSISLLRVNQIPSAASVLTQNLASLPPLHHIPPHAKSIPLYKALSSDGDIIEELRGDRA